MAGVQIFCYLLQNHEDRWDTPLSLGDAIIFREISFNNSGLLGKSSPNCLMNLCCSIKLRSSTVHRRGSEWTDMHKNTYK
jgi:hypothetical protein